MDAVNIEEQRWGRSVVEILLGKIRTGRDCFDLMIAFCDRAMTDGRLDHARAFYNAAIMIHRG